VGIEIRHAEPEDYPPIIADLNDWWGGRQMADMLPRLFFTHFRPTSFVAIADGDYAGFIAAFVSQTNPAQAYVHFVGVNPAVRGAGLGRTLYERVFEAARAADCAEVRCITSPVNTASIAFHRRMGFEILPGPAERDGVPYTPEYDGPGNDAVRFRYRL
jgi:ribosomal protein S18 acetylase RimI-like enzyme